MNDKPIKVLVVEPMQPCRVQEISGLKDMRDIVGGPIQVIYPFWESVALVCNESGKIQGLPYNRPLFGENGCPYDIICGNFFVAGIGEEDFISLTEEQIQRYKDFYDKKMILTVKKPAPQREETGQKKRRNPNHER